jgi:flavin reductase (DIM6/NTAB) family NADH-FMN oxidoreductase RutF
MVANWFSQISFTPRLASLALQKTSYSHSLVQKGRVLALNIFRKEDERLIKAFTKSRERKPDKLDGAAYTLSPLIHCPIIDGAAAYLEIRVRQIHDTGGDHDLIIGEVVGAGVLKEGDCADTLTLPHLGWSYAG